MECFNNNPLEFVRDVLYDGPGRDESYPQRGYIAPNNGKVCSSVHFVVFLTSFCWVVSVFTSSIDSLIVKFQCHSSLPFLSYIFTNYQLLLNNYYINTQANYVSDPTLPTNGGMLFQFEYILPSNLFGDRVLIQWRYVTGNTCEVSGYDANFAEWRTPTLGKVSLFWLLHRFLLVNAIYFRLL